jgi:hypothetical protein
MDNSEQKKNVYFERLFSSIRRWMDDNLSSEEFREFKLKQTGHVIADEWERSLGVADEYLEPFQFTEEVEKQHDLITSFFDLKQSQLMTSQCEYYFRRFPFSGLPVSRGDHIRNMCEFYFGCFYITRSQLKVVLNKLNICCPDTTINIGKMLDQFDKEFDQELRWRNRVHHKQPFDDIGLERIFVAALLIEGDMPNPKRWKRQHLAEYRKFAREWSRRAHKRSNDLNVFVEATALAILSAAPFLQRYETQ